jgi:hypothetical protein
VTFRVYTYGNTGDLDPDQRGFRGAASGGQDLVVHGRVIGPTGSPEAGTLAFRLDSVTPNPVLGSAVIAYSAPETRIVDLAIYDVQGRAVRTLLANHRATGDSSVRWDGLTDRGASAQAGVYFAVLRSGAMRVARSLVLFR